MKTKQELIQEAFIKLIGEDKFNLIKAHIQEDGWCVMFDEDSNKITPTFKELGLQYDLSLSDTDRISNIGGTLWRPKSLAGIETNNGWTRIGSEDDLPKEDGTYYVMTKDGMKSLYWMSGMGKRYNVKKWMEYKPTHFQKEVIPPPPIY
ncbi:hypothetical protein D3C87_447580 [compost metagenome]